jgi:hypothetical protein
VAASAARAAQRASTTCSGAAGTSDSPRRPSRCVRLLLSRAAVSLANGLRPRRHTSTAAHAARATRLRTHVRPVAHVRPLAHVHPPHSLADIAPAHVSSPRARLVALACSQGHAASLTRAANRSRATAAIAPSVGFQPLPRPMSKAERECDAVRDSRTRVRRSARQPNQSATQCATAEREFDAVRDSRTRGPHATTRATRVRTAARVSPACARGARGTWPASAGGRTAHPVLRFRRRAGSR